MPLSIVEILQNRLLPSVVPGTCEWCGLKATTFQVLEDPEEHADNCPYRAVRDALEIAEESGCWMYDRCDECGHRLRFESDGCPQCGASFGAPWKRTLPEPDKCYCARCVEARKADKASKSEGTKE